MIRHLAAGAFAVLALISLVACGGSDDDDASPPPPPPPPAIGSVTVTLAPPATAGGRVSLAWSVAGSGTAAIAQFRVQVKRSDAAAYEPLVGGIAPGAVAQEIVLPNAATLIWHEAKVKLQACDATATCVDSNEQALLSALLALAGYFKASNTGAGDQFGASVALSADGNTMAIGAYGEDSAATGIDGNQGDNSATESGAAYVFVREAGAWRQQAYLKGPVTGAGAAFGVSVALSADGGTLAVGAYLEDNPALGALGSRNGAVHVFVRSADGAWSVQGHLRAASPGIDDFFGFAIALSADGSTLAVGAQREDSNATGIDGDATNGATADSGAVYLFARNAGTWSQAAYVKASNTGANDGFGVSVALAAGGRTLAAGAIGERSAATGIGGDQADDSAPSAGAVFVFLQDAGGTWTQQAYIKASNTQAGDSFGIRIALAADGNTLAVGANGEDSSATGIDGNQADNAAADGGALYVFVRAGATWSQQAYLKPSNSGTADRFGVAVALSSDGNVLVAGATGEDSNASGVGGNGADDSASNSGAAYVFARTAGAWTQRAYVKAPNTGAGDFFGLSTALSGDGSVFAVGAFLEASAATGIGGDRNDNSAPNAGAVFVY